MRAGGTEPYCLRSPEPGVLDTEKAGGRFRDAGGVICVELTEFADSAREALEWVRTHKNGIPEFTLRQLWIEKEYERIVLEHYLEVVPFPGSGEDFRRWAVAKGVALRCWTEPESSEEEDQFA